MNLFLQQTLDPDEFPYLNMENYVAFDDWQHALLIHILVIGFAAHIAGIFYFALTRHRASGRYAASSIMSVVVMVSAGLLLYRLYASFDEAFIWNAEVGQWVLTSGEPDGSTYSHGYRYLNWLIDVPLLLTQLLFAFELTASEAYRMRLKLASSGAAMVVLGYVGQFYEATSVPLTLLWGALSTIPYIYFSVIVWREIGRSQGYLPAPAAKTMNNIKLLFLFSWGLYPIAYLVPTFQLAFFDGVSAGGAVTRTFLFTIADVTSKIMFGVLLGKVLQIRSAAEGHEPAIAEFPQIVDLRGVEPVGAGSGARATGGGTTR